MKTVRNPIMPALLSAGAIAAMIFNASAGHRMVAQISGFWGNAYDASIKEDYAYVATAGTGLRVMDISDPSRLAEVGLCDSRERLRRIRIWGNYAFASGEQRMEAYDLGDPTHPRLAASVDVGFGITDLAVSNGMLALGGNYEYDDRGWRQKDSLAVFLCDTTNGDLQIADWWRWGGQPDTNTAAVCVAMNDSLLVVGGRRLRTFLLVPPDSATFLSEVDITCKYLALRGNTVYGTHSAYLETIDLTDPNFPQVVRRTRMSGWARGLSLNGDLIAVSSSDNELLLYDLSEPDTILLASQIQLQQAPGNVMMTDSRAILCARDNWLYLLDISHPASPRVIGSCHKNPGTVTQVAASGTLGCLATSRGEIEFADLTDMAEPRIVSFIKLPAPEVLELAMGNGFALAAKSGSMYVINTSYPEEPAVISRIECENISRVTVEGRYAFVNANGLKIYDLTDLAEPMLVAEIDGVMWLRIEGEFLQTISRDSINQICFRSYSIAEPPAPQLLGSCDISEQYDLSRCDPPFYAHRNALFFVKYEGYPEWPDFYLEAVDVSGATGALLSSTYFDYFYKPTLLGGEGGQIFLPSHSTVGVWDLWNPSEPHKIDSIATNGGHIDLHLLENYALLASQSVVKIYDCSEDLGIPPAIYLHPSSFILSVYPNPFNSSTTIRFNLPRLGSVHLEVYDPLGRRVKELIPGRWMSAGEQRVVLNGRDLSSGMYWLQLGAGGEVSQRAVSLVK